MIAGIYAPYVTDSIASFEQTPPDADEIARRMLAPPRLPWFLATRSDAPVGYCYASHHRARPGYRWSVDCSVYLADDARGQGTARALYEQLIPQLPVLGYVTAFAGIALPNPASVKLHEALGFNPVGVFKSAGFKQGAWRDVGWWRLALRDPPPQPAPPRSWHPVHRPYQSSLQADVEWT